MTSKAIEAKGSLMVNSMSESEIGIRSWIIAGYMMNGGMDP